MIKEKKSNKLFLMPELFPEKNPLLWVKLLTSISRTGHTSGPTSENYIQGYQAVFKKWGITKGNNLDLKLIDRLLRAYNKTGSFPGFNPRSQADNRQ